MPDKLFISRFVAAWFGSPFEHADNLPWRVIQSVELMIRSAIGGLGTDYHVEDQVAVHRSVTIEAGTILKVPAAICGAGRPWGRIASSAQAASSGPASCSRDPSSPPQFRRRFHPRRERQCRGQRDHRQLRDELAGKTIRILIDDVAIDTGVEKCGALVGDGTRIGANAVVGPGALLALGTLVGRLHWSITIRTEYGP